MEKQTKFNILHPSSLYRTNDIWIGGTLLAVGRKLVKLEWAGPVAIFVFENAPDCESVVEAYFHDDLTVRAKRLTDALRTLKYRLFTHKRLG